MTAGRDGVVRVLELPGLATRTSGIIDAPLSALAIHPSGAFLAVGDARGGVHFLSLPDLSPMGTLEAHADEVRGLAFTAGGALVSGSWDRTVAVHATEQTVERVASARVQPLREQGLVMLRATVNGRAQIPMALDARVPAVVLTAKAAEDAGLSPSSRVLEIPTALGLQRAPIAERQRLHFRELGLEADVAICDACVPKGAQGILGAPFEAAVGVVFAPDGAAELTIREGREVPAVPVVRANLTRRHALQAHVNAVALDASGGRVALALSDVPARRTREIYQREKAGIEEPLAPGNAAVVLELSSGRELTRQAQHRGVVSAVALSPDGRTLASGGWDRRVLLRSVATGVEVGQWKGGWSIRSLRFGRDGRRLVAAAWTPINATGDQRSDPSVQLFELDYVAPDVRSASASGP